jgi:hypothetical protein
MPRVGASFVQPFPVTSTIRRAAIGEKNEAISQTGGSDTAVRRFD